MSHNNKKVTIFFFISGFVSGFSTNHNAGGPLGLWGANQCMSLLICINLVRFIKTCNLRELVKT